MGLLNLEGDGAATPIENIASRDAGENEYGNDFKSLLEFLGENFVENDNDDVTLAIPSYASENDLQNSSGIASKTHNGYESIVVVGGEVYRCVE